MQKKSVNPTKIQNIYVIPENWNSEIQELDMAISKNESLEVQLQSGKKHINTGTFLSCVFHKSFRNVSVGAENCYCNRPSGFGLVVQFQGPGRHDSKVFGERGQFDFEIKHNAGKDIPHADCLLRVQPELEDTTVFIAALTFEENVHEQADNPWMLLQNTDNRNLQRKQQEHLAKVFSWLKNKQRRDSRACPGV